MDSPKSEGSFFDGLDLQIGGTLIDCSGGPITPEIIDEAAKRLLDTHYVPCGMKGNPHLVRPAPVGEITACFQCGYCCTQADDGSYRDLNKEENERMYQAFKSLMDKASRKRKRRRSL